MFNAGWPGAEGTRSRAFNVQFSLAVGRKNSPFQIRARVPATVRVYQNLPVDREASRRCATRPDWCAPPEELTTAPRPSARASLHQQLKPPLPSRLPVDEDLKRVCAGVVPPSCDLPKRMPFADIDRRAGQ